MKIAFLWHFTRAREVLPNWRDGHRKVIEELGKVHEVKWFLDIECNNIPDDYEFILVWSDAADHIIQKYLFSKARKGLMLTSENYIDDYIMNLKYYDVIYCESDPIKEHIRRLGCRAIKAMGTDTDFFTPQETKKDIPYFFPGTFSPWKLQSKIAHLGDKLYCVGTVQPDGTSELEACLKNNVHVETGYFPPEKIRDYYNRAEKVIIPSIHGSERTVLEAMAMNIVPEVTNEHNKKASSYVMEYKSSNYKTPREFILNNYSHVQYLQALLKGIEE